ncbi:MAG TPA: prenyltransferase/squalene oxidase repeat-containing protein [Gemmataceae bacterium]|nr:prenyltransferase/squalene oxidase repeat-containing protein [Gemmataceae bacterium]
MLEHDRLEAAYQTALAALLNERTPDGHWVGELSTSALSTATAVMALHLVGKHGGRPSPPTPLPEGEGRLQALVDGGLAWLAAHQNEDGGWGDTTVSFSNISTTMLCRSAFYLAKRSDLPTVARAEAWLTSKYGPASQWPEAIRQRYGKDRTFATPILTTCALAGLVSWDEVPPLPFELAVLPQSWYRFVRLHVVSYALPALIAIGQCIYEHRKPWNPLSRVTRALARHRSLRVLQEIQPSSGGFLEATPLTSFVTLSLASIGHANHPVAANAVEFLVRSVRPDGSWPIDTNLATWVTTLSVNALAAAGELDRLDRKDELRAWLLGQQYKTRHPYTGADPGGWAWTDLPGGVPDADDTPGAMLAIRSLPLDSKIPPPQSPKEGHPQIDIECAIGDALMWLVFLQNGDGGWPTFCRGWGHLPFDRSGSDLTAHVIRSLKVSHGYDPRHMQELLRTNFSLLSTWNSYGTSVAIAKGLRFLSSNQRPDGSWLPLWFGNQHMPDDENPTYGTARVLAAYRDLAMMDTEPARKGIAWLLANQNPDGGWGGGRGSLSSIEESALAIDVLVDAGSQATDPVNRGLAWLVEQVERGGLFHPTPIGFYFAKLWYYEKLYPIIFTVSALGRFRRLHP